MLIFNPTKETIYQDYCNRNYKIESGEAKTFFDDVGEHLIRKHKDFGLVALDYDEKAEAQYGSLAAYKKAKAIEGLSNFLVKLGELRKQEAFGVKESIEKNASPEIAMSFRVDYFEEKIKEVQAQINELRTQPSAEASFAELVESKEEIKRRGRPPLKKEEISPLTA